ncbi:NAD(P)H-binding protein [Fulvivirgaceae bacterium PWU5]|uniref:NAD(P)H-binding protein n=1 Tax=Dawidia cretensis TaxID=2782350 RepID=A0AAP2E2S0_9BACT|nr:NAD(P)H-binding protein [Dawidia cretensis]MBT1710994.1 NAD(P)H-binding protein [Dawidia cretensis]
MKIAIIGAAAGIGLEAVIQGLILGHHISALSTKTEAIPNHSRLTKVKGSATNVADLISAIRDTDAVLVTVGTKKKKGTTLFSEIAAALIEATEALDYKQPVIIITGFGSGASKPYLNLFLRTVIRLFLKDQYADKTIMENRIIASNMNWEIVRPTMLTNGPLNQQHYAVATQPAGNMKQTKVSRANVAYYLLDEAENQRHLGTCVAITGA